MNKSLSSEDIQITFNLPEVILGVTTDRGAQDIHDFEAIGAALVIGIPTKTKDNNNKNRKAEFLLGGYYSCLKVPDWYDEEVDGKSRTFVRSSHSGYPDYNTKNAFTTRADVRIPVGVYGYFSVPHKNLCTILLFNLETLSFNPRSLPL